MTGKKDWKYWRRTEKNADLFCQINNAAINSAGALTFKALSQGMSKRYASCTIKRKRMQNTKSN